MEWKAEVDECFGPSVFISFRCQLVTTDVIRADLLMFISVDLRLVRNTITCHATDLHYF